MRKQSFGVFLIIFLLIFISGMFATHPAQADNTIVLPALGTPYYQDFNTLSNSTESGTMPPGWVLDETKSAANNLYNVNTENSNIGDTYSFGSINSTDRALGGIQDDNLVPLFGASFSNYTGGTIHSLTIKFTGEEWRLGKTGRSDKIRFEFSLDATDLNNGTWQEYEDLTFFTPNIYTDGSKNGNLGVNQSTKQYTILGLSIAPGGSFWIRWSDYNPNGYDDGLAVDDFSLTPFGSDNAPTLEVMTPTQNAINVALDAKLSVSFSEPVNLVEGWLSLSCSNSDQHTITVSGGPQTYLIDPEVDFANGDTCTISVIAAKVTDQDSADPPDVLDKDYSFSFSTIPLPDNAPIVTNTSPTNNENAVLLESSITVQFSEPVDVSTEWFTLICSTSGIHSAKVSGGPSFFILTPQNPFQYNESCSLTLNSSKIADQDDDDPPDLMPSDSTITFSTLSSPDTAPYILSSIPANNTKNFPVNQEIELTFSEPVTLDSKAFNITCESGTDFSLKLTGGPTVYQVKPDHDFNFADNCSLTVLAQDVVDQDLIDPPDNMPMDQTIRFETESNPDSAPAITKTMPVNGAIDVAIDSGITITFTEDVSISDEWAKLTCSISGDHTFVTSGTSQIKMIQADIAFANNESCTLTLLASQIHDLDMIDPPDEMAENYILTFSTAPPTDQPPSVVETYPPNLAVNVPVDKNFSVTFSEPVNPLLEWIEFKCTKSGPITIFLDDGPIKFSLEKDQTLDYSETCTVTMKADKIYDLDTIDPPDFMGSDYTFSFTTEKSPDETTPPTIVDDGNSTPFNEQYLSKSLNHLFVQFSKDVLHDGSNDAADNIHNYSLISWGANHVFDTTTCDNVAEDDESVPIDGIVYDAATFKADLAVNHTANLPDGKYRLIICGDHTIKDIFGNPLNNGANSIITFTIATSDAEIDPTGGVDPTGSGTASGGSTNTSTSSTKTGSFSQNDVLIPVTGFPRGAVTLLPPQQTKYADFGNEWLEVPELDIDAFITGVPKKNGTWDVTWLGSQAGLLEGSAQLGNPGNSVLTAHVWDALNRPGPFYGLEKLKYGDKVIVHAWGNEYVYEVREVLSVKPDNVKAMMKHQEKAWLTLVTCQGYDEESGEYSHRVLVRAVLMEVR